MNFEVGDIVKLKKQHPCGSSEWEILRVGADFRLTCMGFQRAAGGEERQRDEGSGWGGKAVRSPGNVVKT